MFCNPDLAIERELFKKTTGFFWIYIFQISTWWVAKKSSPGWPLGGSFQLAAGLVAHWWLLAPTKNVFHPLFFLKSKTERQLTLNLWILRHQQNGPLQCGCCRLRSSHNEIQDGCDQVVIMKKVLFLIVCVLVWMQVGKEMIEMNEENSQCCSL